VEITNAENDSIFSNLDSKAVLKSSDIRKFPAYAANIPGIYKPMDESFEFPAYAANIPGIYKPMDESFEGLDAIVVLPSETGKREDNILIVIEAKNSLLENSIKKV
jgi:hypothetical protein